MTVKEFLKHVCDNADITHLWIVRDIESFLYDPHLRDKVIYDFGDSEVDCWDLSVYSDHDIVELNITIK